MEKTMIRQTHMVVIVAFIYLLIGWRQASGFAKWPGPRRLKKSSGVVLLFFFWLPVNVHWGVRNHRLLRSAFWSCVAACSASLAAYSIRRTNELAKDPSEPANP
jgi:hypothetical protein